MRDVWAAVYDICLAGLPLGVLLIVAGLVGMSGSRTRDWWRARHRVGTQITDRMTADRPYAAGIARGGDH